jgi:hypothetical protein
MGEWPAHYCGPGGEEKGRGVARDGGTAREVARLWGVGRLEVGETPDRWAPPVGDRVREREGWSGPADKMGQRSIMGLGGKERKRVDRGEKEKRREGWAGPAVGKGLDRFCFVFFLFFKSFLTHFKFKSSHKVFQLFHKYFKTFKTTPQPKLMHFNMMHKHLGDSNY